MKQKTGFRGGLAAHKTALCFFAGLLLYGFLVVRRSVPPEVSMFEYYFYAVDFSLGFVGRFLVGAVFNLFVQHPTPQAAAVYVGILLLLFIAGLSLMLERLVFALPKEKRPLMGVLLAFYLTGPATFGMYFYQYGMLDTHWLFLALPFVLLLQNRKTQWVLPLLFVPMVMIQYASLFNWVLFCGLLVLYELTLATEKADRRRLGIVFLTSVLLASGTFLYFQINEKKNVTYPVDTFNEILADRGVQTFYYFDHLLYDDFLHDSPELAEQYSYYNEIHYVDHFPDMPENFFKNTVNRLSYMFREHAGYYAQNNWYGLKKTVVQMGLLTLILSPAIVLFYGVLHKKFKAAKGRLIPRFTYFCMMALLPVSAVATIPVSSDSVRWLGQGFLILFSLILYMIYKEKEQTLDVIGETLRKIPRPAVAVYYGIWFFTVLNPYV